MSPVSQWVRHSEVVPELDVDLDAQSGASPLHPTAFNHPFHGCAPP